MTHVTDVPKQIEELLEKWSGPTSRRHFLKRSGLLAVSIGAATLVVDFAALAVLVQPANISPVVLADPDDDAVLACALAAQANAMGDAGVVAPAS